MPLFLAVDEDDVGLDAAVCRQYHAVVPHALGRLDSFGEVDFAVGDRCPLSGRRAIDGYGSRQALQRILEQEVKGVDYSPNVALTRSRIPFPRAGFRYLIVDSRSLCPIHACIGAKVDASLKVHCGEGRSEFMKPEVIRIQLRALRDRLTKIQQLRPMPTGRVVARGEHKF